MHSLLVVLEGSGGGASGGGGDEGDSAAVARAAAAALAATVRTAAADIAAARVIHPMLSRCEVATAGCAATTSVGAGALTTTMGGGGVALLTSADRGAVMGSLCAVTVALTDPAAAAIAVDALAAGPCARLSAAARAGDRASVVGELRVLAAWVDSGVPGRASEARLDEVWSVSGAIGVMACDEVGGAGGVGVSVSMVRQCCELWKGLAAALTWPGIERHALAALAAAKAVLQRTGNGVVAAAALGVVASTVQVCGTTSSGELQALAGAIVVDATVALKGSCAGQTTREPEALAALFAAASATLAAKHAFSISCVNPSVHGGGGGGSADALVSLAANLSRGVEVEPTRSALAFIETLWSSAAFVSRDDATAAAAVGLSLPGAYVRVLGANLAAAAAECATPQLLEPMGHALWAMVNTCHEEGGDALLGWLSGVLAHAVTVGSSFNLNYDFCTQTQILYPNRKPQTLTPNSNVTPKP